MIDQTVPEEPGLETNTNRTISHAVSHQLKMKSEMIRIDQSIKDASQILRELNEDGEDLDIEGDFGEYNNNNIITIGTKSKQPHRLNSNNTASLKREGNSDKDS